MKISIIVPVYKEQNINNFLKQFLNHCYFELIVVDGDGLSTVERIQSQVRDITTISSQKGRANQMNCGAKLAKGEMLLFLHADTYLPNNALDEIEKSSQKYVAGAFDFKFDTQKIILKIISTIASLRSRVTRIPYGDQAIFIKKDVFEALGGYEDILLMEDVALMRKLKKHKHKINILNSKVTTSARKWEERGIIYTTLRNWVLILLYLIGVKPNALARFYF